MSAIRSIAPALFRSVAPRRATLAAAVPARQNVVTCKTFSTTRLAANSESDAAPEHASIDPTITEDWPSIEERDHKDVGHSTTGSAMPIGKHSKRTLSTFSFEDKVCVITGAARGLGNMFARTFVESGCNSLVIMDLDKEMAVQAAKDIEDWFVSHGQAKPHEISALGIGLDVSDEAAVKKAMQQVVDTYGKIDVLVTSAGIVHNYPATEYPTEKFNQLMSINVNGCFYCAREAAKFMQAAGNGGSIVLVGSMSGSIVNVPQAQAPYNASKAAVKHLASSLAVEWAKDKIRVNCLSPGYMATSLTRTILDNNPALRETWEGRTPMGRVGEPEDLKGAIAYLASDASAFTTGIDLQVDGGYCIV